MSQKKTQSNKKKAIEKLYEKADKEFTDFLAISLEAGEEFDIPLEFDKSERIEIEYKGNKTLTSRYSFINPELKPGTRMSILSNGKLLKDVVKYLEKGDKVIVSKNERGHWRINLAE